MTLLEDESFLSEMQRGMRVPDEDRLLRVKVLVFLLLVPLLLV